MTPAAPLTPLHLDALRELCNLCGGRAADALSRLLGERPVDLGLSDELPRGELGQRLGGSESVVAARVELAGPVHGELWLVLGEPDAKQLSSLLDADAAGVALLALSETANIVASAALNALYSLTGITVVPGVPEVVRGSAERVLDGLDRGGATPVLSTELGVRAAPVRGRLLLAPSGESVGPLLEAMGVG